MTGSDLLEQPRNKSDDTNKLVTNCILVDNSGQAVRTQLVDSLLADLLQAAKPLFHSSQKPTRKLTASVFKYCDWMKVLAASAMSRN